MKKAAWAVCLAAAPVLIAGCSASTKTVAGPTVVHTQTATATETATAIESVTETATATRTLHPTIRKVVATRTHTLTVTYTPRPKPAINDGVYQVGRDINPGQWRTKGGSDCYFSVNNDANGQDIVANGDSSGPQIADLSSGQFFELSGGCDWRHD